MTSNSKEIGIKSLVTDGGDCISILLVSIAALHKSLAKDANNLNIDLLECNTVRNS